jgi:ABC-2 type transport system permease protein
VNFLRVFSVGGLTSYRALFHWLNPWVFFPMLIVTPLFQLLFFAYLGRATQTADDTFYVVGNSLLAASLPCIWGMSWSIGGERRTRTLETLLASPASRIALFLGRSLPAIANGFAIAVFCFVVGSLLLDVHVDTGAALGLVVAALACSFSCAALGLAIGALGLRGRNVTVLNNLFLAVLLLVAGIEVPLARMPHWVQQCATFVPLMHGVRAARELADGRAFGTVEHLLAVEVAVGAAYLLVGAALLRLFEHDGRRTGSLGTF